MNLVEGKKLTRLIHSPPSTIHARRPARRSPLAARPMIVN
jgi:hypothetical protein